MESAAIVTKPTFTLADRLRIQQERVQNQQYKKIGMLTTVVIEQQMSTRGMSQSQRIDRCSDPRGVKKLLSEGKIDERVLPFSAWQANAWAKCTLEWLHYRRGSLLAISFDRNDLLLPFGLAPLPDIPDPNWVPKQLGGKEDAPRIPQNLEDRAFGQIKDRRGKLWLVIQPLTELCVAIGAGRDSGFGRIKCMTDPADRTHSALLVNPYPNKDGFMEAHFVGGSFHAGF